MSDYTPEHVETRAALYDEINVPETRDMLRAYAATLRQQGGAAVTDEMIERAVRAAYWYDTTERLHIDNDTMGVALKAALAQNCCCGDPKATGVHHRTDGPCYRAERAKDSTYPFESALAELIEAVDPSIESGDVIADAHAAAMAVTARRNTERATVPEGWRVALRKCVDCLASAITGGKVRAYEAAEAMREAETLLAAAPSQQGERGFGSPEALAGWLESLHEADADGAITGGKWEAAQVAAHAIRNMSIQQGFVQLPPDWKREGMVVIADALTGRLLGCMGHTTWDAQVRADTAQGGDAKAALAQNTQGEVSFVYPEKPRPRAWGYLDDSGVEWAGYDVSQMEAYARAAVALHAERATVPDGMVLVPRMITTEMWKAWEQADLLGESYRQNYAAMLAAAPSQPEDAQS